MASTTNPVVSCAEAIAILYLLHSVPTPPSSNPSTSTCPPENYLLPFERERNLADTLAFLSSIKDNPNHIPALCIREDPEQEALDVLVAVNEAKCGDGRQALQNIEAGFERLFSLLSMQNPQHVTDIESDVFAAIVSMCSERIRGRLRFITREAPKQPVKQILQNAMQALKPASPAFDERSKAVIAKIDSWSQHQTLARLQDVVEVVHHLSRLDGLHEMLDSVPNRQMDPSDRKNLWNIVTKVARYRDAARYLYRTAKKFAPVRRMRVVLVSLPEDAFRGAPAEQPGSTLSSTLARLNLPNKHGQIWYLLGVSELEAGDQFAKQRDKTMSEAKIHAEVQLIFYCETTGLRPLPRVICSSKDACFLCNAFIAVHGKFHTPRSHGRLYPGWRLPPFPQSSDLERRFTRTLENYAHGGISMILSKQKKTFHPDPRESTIFTLPLSNSTQRSLSGGSDITIMPADNDVGATSSLKSRASDGLIAAAQKQTPEEPSSKNPEQGGPEPLPSLAESTARRTELTPLPQGKTLAVAVEANDTSAVYEAWPMRLRVEYSAQAELVPQQNSRKTLVCHLEWLEGEDAEAVRRAGDAMIVDAELLQGCIPIRPDDLDKFYISARGSLLRIHIG